MTGAREEILARLRQATLDVTRPSDPRDPAPLAVEDPAGDPVTLQLFADRVADYRATVTHASPADVGREVAAALARARAHRVVVPSGLDPSWVEPLRDSGIHVMADDGLSAVELDAVDAVVTAARLGIATTGTIVLDHTADQGRRALTLVPDQHVCVVRADQLVRDVADAVAVLDPLRPLTWVSGPSATSDIELTRVEGVHGPRVLDVVIVRSAGALTAAPVAVAGTVPPVGNGIPTH